jgi:stage II sporulation protein D
MISLLRFNLLIFIFLVVGCFPLEAKKVKKRSKKKKTEQELVVEQSVQQPAAPAEQEQPKKKFQVLVLLAEKELDSDEQWLLAASKGFVLHDIKNERQQIVLEEQRLTISTEHGLVYVNGKRATKGAFAIRSLKGHLAFGTKQYPGFFVIARDSKKAYLINVVDIEDYLLSVLSSEGWPGWPLEMNKVLAIACRSYVTSMVLEAQTQGRLYHVKSTNAHQTYHGVHNKAHLKDAIEQTRGIVVGYNDKPIVAMFDSCCGGVIPAKISGINFSKAPYLKRTYPCKYCKRCSLYEWEAVYTLRQLEEYLKKEIPSFKKLRDVNITKKDSAGLVQRLNVRTPSRHLPISGKKIYSLLKNQIKSFFYSVDKKGNTIVFNGRGYGHHLGLCQWGAREMVRDGFDHREILSFYYPGTAFMRLKS